MGADQKKDSKFQTFLDTHQYARKGILLYERIFGTTYVSTGGESTTAKFCSELSAHSLKVGYLFDLRYSYITQLSFTWRASSQKNKSIIFVKIIIVYFQKKTAFEINKIFTLDRKVIENLNKEFVKSQ